MSNLISLTTREKLDLRNPLYIVSDKFLSNMDPPVPRLLANSSIHMSYNCVASNLYTIQDLYNSDSFTPTTNRVNTPYNIKVTNNWSSRDGFISFRDLEYFKNWFI